MTDRNSCRADVTLLVVGGLNTAISLFYYLRVVKIMTIDPEPEHRLPVSFPLVSFPGALRRGDDAAGAVARFLVGRTLPVGHR